MTAGKVQTVLSDVDPSALGVTLTHEHLLVSLVFRRPASGEAQGAQRATGAALLIHPGRSVEAPLEAMGVAMGPAGSGSLREGAQR